MYDCTVKDPCKYGLAEHVGERICVRCGAVWNGETMAWEQPKPRKKGK